MNEVTLKENAESLVRGFLGEALTCVSAHEYCGVVEVSIAWDDGPSIKEVIVWAACNIPQVSSVSCDRNVTTLNPELPEQDFARRYGATWALAINNG